MADDHLLNGRLIRAYLERLRDGADLTQDPVLQRLAPLTKFGGVVGSSGALSEPAAVARGLRAVWRQRFMPPALSLERRTPWHYFFLLEVLYFYPYAHGGRYPATLKDAAVLLCDEAHLALIIADGDAAQAQTLLQANRAFWKGIVPEAMIPAVQTLHSRRDAALEKLADELNRRGLVGQRADLVSNSVPAHEVTQLAPVAPTPPVISSVPIFPAGQTLQPEVLSPGAARLLAAGIAPSKRERETLEPAGGLPVIQPADGLLDQMMRDPAQITPARLDELALWLWPLGFPQSLGVAQPVSDGVWWWNRIAFQRRLVELLTTTPTEPVSLLCGAALRQSSLEVLVRARRGSWPCADCQWISALEVLADRAREAETSSSRQILRATLARTDAILKLQAFGGCYADLGQSLMALLR